jgi:hypothetical protein
MAGPYPPAANRRRSPAISANQIRIAASIDLSARQQPKLKRIGWRPQLDIFIVSVTIAPTFGNDSMSAILNLTPNAISTPTMKLI